MLLHQEQKEDFYQVVNTSSVVENSFCGFQSLALLTKEQVNVSSLYFKLETTFLEEVEETQMKVGSEFMYAANCYDLWKYFLAKVKKFYNIFSVDDYQIIKKVTLTMRIHLQNHLIRQCRKQLSENHPLIRKKELIMKKYRKNSSKANSYAENFDKFLQKLQITDNSQRIKAIFLYLQIDHVKKNEPLIVNFLTSVLHFVYTQIRLKEKYDNKAATSMYLMILYLKISLQIDQWLSVLQSKIPVQTMFMCLLGRNHGIRKIIRYFQDAPFDSIKKEYEHMKKYLKN